MKERASEQRQWLEKMHQVITWRLCGPNFKNPFDSNVSESSLEEFIADRSLLMEACTVQAFMDDTEILKITDLTDLKFETNHPNIINIDRDELHNYVTNQGVWEFVNKEFDKLLEECKQELANRKGGGGGSMF